ncbi:MAG: TetR/AcrR family transcriptional regulator [Thermomicrobiales bacterium]
MSPKRSEEFKADREEELLAAARRCFLAQGYDRTTMREIAAEAGVSTGAIYTYFGTKAEILQALCKQQTSAEVRDLQATLAELPPDGDPIAAGLAIVLGKQLQITPAERQAREQANLLVFYEAARDRDLGQRFRESITLWRQVVTGILRQEQAAGRLRESVDHAALANVLIALPIGLEIVELLGGEPHDWAELVHTLSTTLRQGLDPVPQPVPISQ